MPLTDPTNPATAADHPDSADELLRQEADLHRDLFLEVGRLHRRHLMNTLADFDLTPGQYHALNMLAQHEPGCTMSDLAAATYQVLPTMTGIINRLAEHGLVERRLDEADRRTRRVYLTEAGQALMVKIGKKRQVQAAKILGHFAPEDRQMLMRLMQCYLEAVRAVDSEPDPQPED